MIQVTSQFKIVGELITTQGELVSKSDMRNLILERLRSRSAIFDKLIVDDGDGDIRKQLHDHDLETKERTTFVDVTFLVGMDLITALENDTEKIYMKAMDALQKGATLSADTVQNNIAHISFK